MKRTIPLLITAIGGLTLVVAVFIPAFQQAGEEAAIWFDILASIAFVLGGANLARLQLQKISDRQAGWGYAAITLASFVVTLVLGLWKVGCPPEAASEAYGTSAVMLPMSSLPTYSTPLVSPAHRMDGELVPKSVRQQLSIEQTPSGEELRFTGWMSRGQFEDLLNYQDTLEWKCQIERLFEQATLPAPLKGRVTYNAGHEQLSFAGVMSETEEQALRQLLKPGPETDRAIDQLAAASRRRTEIPVTEVPERFSIPEQARETIQLSNGTLSIQGPMSVPTRELLASRWPDFPRVSPQLANEQTELLEEIERLGPSLNERQRTVFENFFESIWSPDAIVLALNTAGISSPVEKSFCQLLEEIQSGTEDPERTTPPPPPVELNAQQIDIIQQSPLRDRASLDQLVVRLRDAGTLTEAQEAALRGFFDNLPTIAEYRKELCFRLLGAGSLSREQMDFLLNDYRKEFHWKQQVGQLFTKAHVIKFPWSGHYSAQGSPFWWLYEYVLQPLMTTTFALLGFYVASAAFRAFRAKNLEATLLLGTAFIVLLGRTSAGPALTGWIPENLKAFRLDQMTIYIMSIFGTAGNRAIMIGIALGTIATSLKVLLGIDRSYLGRGDD